MIRAFLNLPNSLIAWLEPASTPLLTTLARFIFAAVLLMYFWNSGLTKLPEGMKTYLDGGEIALVDALKSLLSPTFNAFAQIFPKGAEAAGYDITQASQFQKIVIVAGTLAEFILPALVVIGLWTRAAALGMVVFVIVQSLTDIYGHGGATGAWFDNLSDAVILDQRALWVFLLLYLVFKGGGPFSIDRFLRAPQPYYDEDY